MPGTIDLGQSATLEWNVELPTNCAPPRLMIGTRVLDRPKGTLSVKPNGQTTYSLTAWTTLSHRTLATTTVAVNLPTDSTGLTTVHVTANNQQAMLIQALGTPGAVVFVENHVNLDLTSRATIGIAEGVRLIGFRTSRDAGGRLYVTRPHPNLFEIRGNNVRITGLRIDGGERGVADAEAWNTFGILMNSKLNVEIANNEIYGWRGAAVRVDDQNDQIHRSVNAQTVRIHDNYIHHNQHWGTQGYGVVIGYGAYALIEKNVFDYNRHAIASDGREGTGYFAYRNLVLPHGGLHRSVLGVKFYTHQFDMHGRERCGIFSDEHTYNCGPAGEYMDIRYDTFLNVDGPGFKLRGTPAVRADLASNVFRHELGVTAPPWVQNETGLNQWDNLIEVDESDQFGHCDFDADGIEDGFLATGATWWFNSGGDRHWVYLNTSTRRLSELALADVDGDGRCDVVSGGMVSSGGTGPWRPRVSSILWQHASGELAMWRMDGGSILGEAYPGVVDGSWQIKGTGDFDGGGDDDILWQHASGQVAIWYGATRTRDVYPGGNVPPTWAIQGVGDFDGDGQSDILWRDADGQLAIWFRGDLADALCPVVYPGYANTPAPVDPAWQVKGVGDFDGDGRSDILWRHTDGQVAIWPMAGGVRTGESYPGGKDRGLVWTIQGVGDFDGDGRSDILWRDRNGQLAIWFRGDATAAAYPSYRNVPGPGDLSWRIQGVRDFDTDGRADILWRHDTGQLAIWLLSGAQFVGDVYPPAVGTDWQVKGTLGGWP